jgi:hypothetical protein
LLVRADESRDQFRHNFSLYVDAEYVKALFQLGDLQPLTEGSAEKFDAVSRAGMVSDRLNCEYRLANTVKVTPHLPL